jgi:hypothetical protein
MSDVPHDSDVSIGSNGTEQAGWRWIPVSSSGEDILAAQLASRAADTGITYVAFTATPKATTLELFGRVPDPSQTPSESNLPEPFDVYSMRQAIEEGFILDVLRNYSPINWLLN